MILSVRKGISGPGDVPECVLASHTDSPDACPRCRVDWTRQRIPSEVNGLLSDTAQAEDPQGNLGLEILARLSRI